VNALQQIVEGERVARGNDEFAIEHGARDGESPQTRYDLGEITFERLTGFRLQAYVVAVAEREATETVPLRLVLNARFTRDRRDESRFHRREFEGYRQWWHQAYYGRGAALAFQSVSSCERRGPGAAKSLSHMSENYLQEIDGSPATR
jgi:hypothetical protein